MRESLTRKKRRVKMSKGFIEFMGASGGDVFINIDDISMITVGSPRQTNNGKFFDPVCVYFKPGREIKSWVEENQDYLLFWIDDEYRPQWVAHYKKCLGVPEFVVKEESIDD
jgi:hypothetical protein